MIKPLAFTGKYVMQSTELSNTWQALCYKTSSDQCYSYLLGIHCSYGSFFRPTFVCLVRCCWMLSCSCLYCNSDQALWECVLFFEAHTLFVSFRCPLSMSVSSAILIKEEHTQTQCRVSLGWLFEFRVPISL